MNRKQQESAKIVQQLPDGRKYCYSCKKYKGRSFFTLKEWNKKLRRDCISCVKEQNEEYSSRHHTGNSKPDPGFGFREFSLNFSRK